MHVGPFLCFLGLNKGLQFMNTDLRGSEALNPKGRAKPVPNLSDFRAHVRAAWRAPGIFVS